MKKKPALIFRKAGRYLKQPKESFSDVFTFQSVKLHWHDPLTCLLMTFKTTLIITLILSKKYIERQSIFLKNSKCSLINR